MCAKVLTGSVGKITQGRRPVVSRVCEAEEESSAEARLGERVGVARDEGGERHLLFGFYFYARR